MAETASIRVTFPDGSVKEFPRGTTALTIAEGISRRLAEAAVAARVNDVLVDLTRPINGDATLQLLTCDDPEGLEVYRHSTAHLLAQAVMELFPEARPTIGPVVEEGFYYDFFAPRPFTPEDLEKIEARMVEIARQNAPVARRELTRQEALELFADNQFKLEMIEEMGDEAVITAYDQQGYVDLCRGPHVPSLGRIKAVKLLKVAGAYWRADARREQLQRVYGISFADPRALRKHLEMLEEAKKRDHRRIGQEMDLFSFHEEGPGFPFWHPRGSVLLHEIVEYWRNIHTRYGYQFIQTPIILNEALWHRSGHWDHYKQNMYFTRIDEADYAVKPMNCPGGLLVYKSRRRSYRELPLRLAELGLVHRHELSGVLHGLFRVRAFTQDDAHIYCMPDQLQAEILGVMNLLMEIYSTFGFTEYKLELSTRPEGRIGSEEIWDIAEGALESALKAKGVAYHVNAGDGAFYGPKIDFHVRDCMGRSWQCGTIQVDFSMPSPERFNASYEGADGQLHTPVMVHRALLGSLERFIGILLEQYAGKLPLWLAPEQVRVLPVSEKAAEYAAQVRDQLRQSGLRAEADLGNDTLQKKVRDAQVERVPYQLVVGERERDQGTVTIRSRSNRQLGSMAVAEFAAHARARVESKATDDE
jgi:threonyl-tRNA synthetase